MSDTYDELSIKNIANWFASTAIIFGGIVPYIPQCREIRRKDDATGLSLYVCLALLIANTLRVLFWFGKNYELPLLLQSILMIFTMFCVINLCVNVRSKNQVIKARDRVFTDLDTKFFWKWTDFRSYIEFMLIFAGMGGILMYLFGDIPIFVEIVGLLAVLTEAMLGIPQFLQNYSNKSTNGMSVSMVTMWTLGDWFKTCYFIIRKAPIQFVVCGTTQIVIDFAILLQVYVYKNNNMGHNRVPTRAD